MSQQKDENAIVVALREVFGRLIETTSKLPAPLAYGSAIIIAVLVFLLLGGIIPNDLLLLLGIIVVASLSAFVIMDWKTRQGNKNRELKRTAASPTPKANEKKVSGRIRFVCVLPETGKNFRFESTSGKVTLGRNPTSDISFPKEEAGVSWDHGMIYLAKGKFRYRHLSKGQNTTVENIDGKKHIFHGRHRREYVLQNQDCICIGRYKYRITIDILGTNSEGYIPTNDIE